jgi:hypothetical protein
MVQKSQFGGRRPTESDWRLSARRRGQSSSQRRRKHGLGSSAGVTGRTVRQRNRADAEEDKGDDGCETTEVVSSSPQLALPPPTQTSPPLSRETQKKSQGPQNKDTRRSMAVRPEGGQLDDSRAECSTRRTYPDP